MVEPDITESLNRCSIWLFKNTTPGQRMFLNKRWLCADMETAPIKMAIFIEKIKSNINN